MTFSFEMVRAHVARLEACDTPQHAFDAFANVMNELGFSVIFAGRLPRLQDESARPDEFFFTRGADAFVSTYLTENRIAVDPVMRYSRRMPRPFRWREAYVDMSKAEAEHIQQAKAAGLRYGIFLPVQYRPGARGIISLGRVSDFELTTEETLIIDLLGRFMFGRLEALMGADEAQSGLVLSEREFQVLELVANGKTNWEVGQILGMSEYSVRDYLKSMSSRMETSNRTHTVVRAIQLGLLWP